jgi:hypothetical protein
VAPLCPALDHGPTGQHPSPPSFQKLCSRARDHAKSVARSGLPARITAAIFTRARTPKSLASPLIGPCDPSLCPTAILRPPQNPSATARLALPRSTPYSTVEPPPRCTSTPTRPRSSSTLVPGSFPRPSHATSACATAGIAPNVAAGILLRHLDPSSPVVTRPS